MAYQLLNVIQYQILFINIYEIYLIWLYWFYNIDTFVDYLMLTPFFFTYILNLLFLNTFLDDILNVSEFPSPPS